MTHDLTAAMSPYGLMNSERTRADEAPLATDEELLVEVCQRSVEALAELYDRHGRHAFALAYKIVSDRGTAEEVTQDAFLSVWRQAATYRVAAGRVRPWLLAIVHHRAIDRLRRRDQRQQLAALDEAWMLAAPSDVFADAYRGVQRDQIQGALARLPAEQRTAINLIYASGNTFQEAAVLTGVASGTVKSRVRLAIAKLRTLLDAELA